jgi:O-antigen ligase
MSITNFQQRTESVARWAMVGTFFLFPIKTSLSNVLLAVVLIAWVLAGQYRKRWEDVRRHPITVPALLMYGLVVIGITYSPVGLAQWAQYLNKYSKFLVMVVFLSLLISDVVWRERCRKAFMYAMTFIVLSTFGNVWFQLPWSVTQNAGWGTDHTVVKDYIFQGICSALFVVMACSEAQSVSRRSLKVLWIVMAGLGALSCAFLLNGRTGLLALIMAALVYVFALAGGRAKRWTIIGATIMGALVLIIPGPAKIKLHDAWGEIVQYQRLSNGDVLVHGGTSSGARLMMWTLSIQEIAKRPLVGAGTGSYQYLAKERLSDPATCSFACVHPHNQFLFFGVEHGLIGIGAFILYLLKAGQYASKLTPLLRASTLGFLAIFVTDSMVHGAMWLSGEQHLFTYMLALWLSYPVAVSLPDQSSSTRRAG